ncbi:hypothetical protein PG985_008914 [Apiospora marii]|uniref:uncharacterized protein n=1 Tax=Apiospora marii TaxID=335849 RepID=UPI00312FE281
MLLRNGQSEQHETNAAALLSAAQDSYLHLRHEPGRSKASDLGKGGRDCYIVFAILLNLNCGFLIHTFQRFGITDGNLRNEILPSLDALKLNLQGFVSDVDKLIREFDDIRFMFQRVSLDLNMSAVYLDSQQGRWVSPFCRRKLINAKGGTAQVWEVSVQDELLSREIKERLKRSEYDDPTYGKCYSMALKTFTSENKEVFNRERQNYLAVEGLAGMVQYLGEYEIEESIGAQGVVCTSNLLLEYGDLDLEELFLSQNPPTSFETIVEFWEALYKVAEALEGIHNLKAHRELGPSMNFHGWHADIKPDNVLRVRGEFKLADLGFAKFRKKDENGLEPSTGLVGLTETYGAPETDRKRRHRRGGTRTDYTQKIDIWSLGCVFSVAATWVVLGCQGVLTYDKLRQNAIEELRKSQAKNIPNTADAFHDGQHVLSAVTEWHGYLRTSMRKSDTITSEILDLIDTQMLQSAPHQRLASRELVIKFAGHVAAAKATHTIQVARGEVTLLSDQIRAAVGQVEKEAAMECNTVFQNQTVSSRSSVAILAHDNYQSVRRNKSELQRQAKQSMRFTRRDIADESSHLSSRMGRPVYATACPEDGVPMIDLRPDLISEAPELQDEERRKASQRLGMVTNGDQYESPGLIPDKYPDGHPSDARSLEGASIPELDTSTLTVNTAELPGRNIVDTHGGSKIEPSSSQTLTRNVDRPYHVEEAYDDSYVITGSSTTSSRSGVTPRTSFRNEIVRSEIIRPPPSFQINPQWPICVELESIKKRNRDFLERFKGKKDDYLSSFLVNRDIVRVRLLLRLVFSALLTCDQKFVIDNGGSMEPYWPAMRITLETLASKIGKLDKDGLDIEFTIGKSHNTSKTHVRKLLQKFDRAREEALQPRVPSRTGTDMATILGQIFSEYLKDTSKAMTLIVLSDGLWEGTHSDEDVKTSIVEFLRRDAIEKKPVNMRWFSIEFISFGDAGLKTFEELDDGLEEKYNIRDVIDHEPVSGDVYKMILGSINKNYDIKRSDTSFTANTTSVSPGSLHGSLMTSTLSPGSSVSGKNSSQSTSKATSKGNRLSKIWGKD